MRKSRLNNKILSGRNCVLGSYSNYKVAVLFGGASPEHEVSLSSSYNIIKGLLGAGFSVCPIGINKAGSWFYYYGDIEKIKTGEWELKDNCSAIIGYSGSQKGILKIKEDGRFEVLDIDVVFAVLHGENGEDGTVQGLLELSGIPYVGCGVLSSSICINKILTHTVLDVAGIKCARWRAIKKNCVENMESLLKDVADELSFPIFTKPSSCGSSVGIKKCRNLKELEDGVNFAFKYGDEVICEEFIKGKEVECAVLQTGSSEIKSSSVGQIEFYDDFYDYDSKYKSYSKIIIPANLKDSVVKQVQSIAIKVFKAMRCSGLARVDFFVDDGDNVYVNEINTMPGFTDISMYPKLWEHSGLSYKDLLINLVSVAIKK